MKREVGKWLGVKPELVGIRKDMGIFEYNQNHLWRLNNEMAHGLADVSAKRPSLRQRVFEPEKIEFNAIERVASRLGFGLEK